MIEVTKDRFFAVVGPMDVHPRCEREHCSWETPHRNVIGRTEPGYSCEDKDGRYTTIKRYWLADRFATAADARSVGMLAEALAESPNEALVRELCS